MVCKPGLEEKTLNTIRDWRPGFIKGCQKTTICKSSKVTFRALYRSMRSALNEAGGGKKTETDALTRLGPGAAECLPNVR